MKFLVGYATTEGQTRKIARHVADRLVDAGHGVELGALGALDNLDLARFDGVVLGASVHIGHYQKALTHFVFERVQDLSPIPTLMLSVSLAAAGHDADDWRGLDKILSDFKDSTGWDPGEVAQVAGAYTPSQYDVFRRFVMRRIIAKRDPDTDLDRDIEYTDWAALDDTVDAWVSKIGA